MKKKFTQLVQDLIHKKPEHKKKAKTPTLENIDLDHIPDTLLAEFDKEDRSAFQELRAISKEGMPSKLKKIKEEIRRNLARQLEERKKGEEPEEDSKEEERPGARRKKGWELEKLRRLRKKSKTKK